MASTVLPTEARLPATALPENAWQEDAALVVWSCVPKLGAATIRALMALGQPLSQLWQAEAGWMASQGVLTPLQLSQWLQYRMHQPPIRPEILQPYQTAGIQIVSWQSEHYPSMLREIFNPPAVLFVQGEVEPLSHPHALAVVGTRKISAYGREVTRHLVAGLASQPVSIVSGMAAGVDTIAHQTALDHGLPTVAVFGCGLDIIYPTSNRRLAHTIVEAGGALISEYPLGTPPIAGQFPQRNRIVVGLSQAVLVTEAAVKSGAMITARLGLEEGRQVMAVPGRVSDEGSQGPLALLRQGATCISSADQIVEDLLGPSAVTLAEQQLSLLQSIEPIEENPPSKPGPVTQVPLPVEQLPAGVEPAVWDAFETGEAVSVDSLAQRLEQSVAKIAGQITLLELDGLIEALPGGDYRRVTC